MEGWTVMAEEVETALAALAFPEDLRALLEFARSENQLSAEDEAGLANYAPTVAQLMYLARIAGALERLADIAERADAQRMLT